MMCFRGTSTVALDDQGDRIVLEPAPDDPITAAEGALAEEFGALDLAQLRSTAREDERASSPASTNGATSGAPSPARR